MEVSDGLDVSGWVHNSHGVKSWMVPTTPLGSYEHTAFVGWVALDAAAEKPHRLGTKEVTTTVPTK